jgi:exosortase D (VPLPA-CTERM-specific)
MIVMLAVGVLLLLTFSVPLKYLWSSWVSSPEYNYGPIIPLIAVAMLWRDLRRVAVTQKNPGSGWPGIAVVALGLLIGVSAVMAAFVFIGQIGLLIVVVGIFIALVGWRRAFAVWPGLVYLGFGIPLTNMVLFNLSNLLQLISSQLGVMFIRLFDITVYLEGNVIDLGLFKLQVVEACSGLRYLFPLSSFGFLCGYLFIAPRWQRVTVFLSSIPITILMNSLRIGITGVLVDRFGVEMAEGFFHDFEGWIIFCGCVSIMLLEMKLLCYTSRGDRSLLHRLDRDWRIDGVRPADASPFAKTTLRPILAVFALTVAAFAVAATLGTTTEADVSRTAFAYFPRDISGWTAVEAPIDQESLDALHPSDFVSLNFVDAEKQSVVNLWSAYYASQRIGSMAHSPNTCIPGGGWEITQSTVLAVPIGNTTLPVNRLLIQKENQRELVYYWFAGRGRAEISETMVKFHILTDGIARNRTDGALVRLVTPIADALKIDAADARLQNFMKGMTPLLPSFIPD